LANIALAIAIAIHQRSFGMLTMANMPQRSRRSRLTNGAGSGRQMTDRRFVFAFPKLNIYEVITAMSATEARHKLMNSSLAPFYGQAVLLNP
jgi:hypothetical protein